MDSSLLHVFSEAVFCSSSKLLGTILGSTTDLPSLKNLDFVSAGARFLKNRRLRSEDALGIVLGLYWASFGCSSGSLGGLLGSSGVLLGVFGGLLSSLGVVFGALRSLLGAMFTLLRTILNSTTGFSELRYICLIF